MIESQCKAVLMRLKRIATRATLKGMARYGIPSENALGVTVAHLHREARTLGKNHALAAELWGTGVYEARMLAVFIDDPAAVTSTQMEAWCKDFDSWAICDTACFHLFDRTDLAWKKSLQWAKRKPEFQRRAGFALMASLAAHRRDAEERTLLSWLPLMKAASTDERNFVWKGVSWAMRSAGCRSATLHAAYRNLAQKLAASTDPAQRRLGKDVLRGLTSASALRRLQRRAQRNQS